MKAEPSASAERLEAPASKSSCASSCATQDHKTYGECLRAKNLQLSPQVNDAYATRQNAWDSELDHYKSALDQGLNPPSTKRAAVDKAIKEAENG